MMSKRLFGMMFAGALGTALSVPAPAASAESSPPALWSDATPAKKAIALPLPALRWGMVFKQVALEIERILDKDYRPLLSKAAGPEKQRLELELATAKGQFRRNRIDFGDVPTSLDATYFRGEYSYGHGESVSSFNYKGEQLRLFFIQDKLWKIIVESALSEASPLGKTGPAAILKLGKRYGTGRVIPSAPDAGRWATEVDWKDKATHLRAIPVGETTFLLAYEDVETLQNLSTLRPSR